MAEDQHLGDKLTVDWRCRWSLVGVRGRARRFREDDHTFSHIFATHPAKCKGRGLPSAGDWDGDALALD